MTDGEHELAAVDNARLSVLLNDGADDAALAGEDIDQPGVEENLSAAADQFLADALDDASQLVGADMRHGVIQYFVRRAVGDEVEQYLAGAAVLGAGVQLAVREGPRAALTELDVAFGVEHASVPEGVDRLYTVIDARAALDQDRSDPALHQRQGAEQPRRTRADDQGTFVSAARGQGDVAIGLGDRGFPGLRPAEDRFFIAADGDVYARDVADIVLAAGVDAASVQCGVHDRLLRDAQLPRTGSRDIGVGIADRQLDVRQADHRLSPAHIPLAQANCRL